MVAPGETIGLNGPERRYLLCQVVAVEARAPGYYKCVPPPRPLRLLLLLCPAALPRAAAAAGSTLPWRLGPRLISCPADPRRRALTRRRDAGQPWKSPYPLPSGEKTNKWLLVERGAGSTQRYYPIAMVRPRSRRMPQHARRSRCPPRNPRLPCPALHPTQTRSPTPASTTTTLKSGRTCSRPRARRRRACCRHLRRLRLLALPAFHRPAPDLPSCVPPMPCLSIHAPTHPLRRSHAAWPRRCTSA